jgi:DNA-binding XRE family transcriptional regulator
VRRAVKTATCAGALDKSSSVMRALLLTIRLRYATFYDVDASALRRLRKRLGVTQAQLAEELGVHRLTVVKWEAGTHRIPESVAKLVSRMLDEGRRRKKTR